MNTSGMLSATGRTATGPATATLTVTAGINSIIEDPCRCDNPLNRSVGGVFLFHDVLRVRGTVGQTLGLASNDGNFLDENGMIINPGTNIPEVPLNSGNYELVFYHPTDIATTITTRMNMDMSTDKSFTSSNCSENICHPIPTMSEWGLMIFALLLLNLGGYFIIKRNRELGF